eukprot:Em0002g153a
MLPSDWTSTTRGWGIPDAMCTDSEGRLWRAGLFGATIVLVGPSHRRAVGQDRIPSPSHDVILLLGKAPPIAPPTMAGTSLGLQLITKLKSGEEESSSSSCESDEEDEPIPLVPMSCEVTPSWSGQRECLHHLCEDRVTCFLQYRVTCSSSTGNMNDLPYYYDNLLLLSDS